MVDLWRRCFASNFTFLFSQRQDLDDENLPRSGYRFTSTPSLGNLSSRGTAVPRNMNSQFHSSASDTQTYLNTHIRPWRTGRRIG
jgi:hypothetical protein